MTQPPRHLPAEQRRAATVAALLALAAEENPADITTTAIARRMKLTQGALFKHFPTKAAMVQAVLTWVSEMLLKRVDAAISSAQSPLDALEAVFETHMAFVMEHPGVPRMLFSELQRKGNPVARRIASVLLQRYAERLSVLIKDGQTRGSIRPDTDVDAAAALFLGTIQGLVVQLMVTRDVESVRKVMGDVFRIYRRGIEGEEK